MRKYALISHLKPIWWAIIFITILASAEAMVRPQVMQDMQMRYNGYLIRLSVDLEREIDARKDIEKQYIKLKQSIMPACFKGGS